MLAPPDERYRYKPFIGSSHAWALDTCSALETTRAVLDIGPGSGAIGAELKKRGYSSLSAVEIDDHARAAVAPIYDEVAANLDPFRGRSFGLILLLDVLEHMVDPFSFLKEVTALAAPGCIILVSVPNIAHWSIRLSLLFGSFTYTKRGILDRTHLQFFTRRRFLEMLAERSECRIKDTAASIEPVEFLLPEAIWQHPIYSATARLRRGFAQLVPGLMAFQHLAIVEKK